MHHHRVLRILLALCAAATLGACALMSKNPVGPEATALREEGLWGDWVRQAEEGDTSILHILPRKDSEGKILDVIFAGGKADDNGWFVLKGHASEIAAGRRYLNLELVATAEGMTKDLDKEYPDRADYPYGFMPYRIVDADHLQLGAIPAELIAKAIQDGSLQGNVSEGSFPVAKLSDTPEKIAAFLAGQDESALFKDSVTFTRIHAPK